MRTAFVRTLFSAAIALAASLPGLAHAQSGRDAYALGCASCHRSEQRVLRKIPRQPEAQRRVWIENFMAQHPCERDDLKPQIVEYLLSRSAR